MVHTQIDIIYGVLVTVGDLRKLGYFTPKDEVYCIDDFHGPNGLSYLRAWHHSWVDQLAQHHPERLPPSLRSKFHKRVMGQKAAQKAVEEFYAAKAKTRQFIPSILHVLDASSPEYIEIMKDRVEAEAAAKVAAKAAVGDDSDDEDSDDDDEFPHASSLVCIGVTIGTVEITRWLGREVPSLAKFNEAAEKFKELAPKELLEVAGPAELQFVPNDCCCCS